MNHPVPEQVEIQPGVKVPTVMLAMIFYIFACISGFTLALLLMFLSFNEVKK